jgi:hypothetical protein
MRLLQCLSYLKGDIANAMGCNETALLLRFKDIQGHGYVRTVDTRGSGDQPEFGEEDNYGVEQAS